jgi:AAA domain-containing protein
LSLAICLQGEPGTGKSWLGASAPAYRLVLDAEGGSRFAPGVKTYWNTQKPPPVPGMGYAKPGQQDTDQNPLLELDWRTCIVQLNDFAQVKLALDWLESGQHPFRSVIIDSITEMQKRVIDQTSGINQPTQQDWGEVLRVTEDLVRRLRDLQWHPINPLECIVLIALTHLRDSKFRPFVKGQLELTLPGFVDVVGYLYVEPDADQQLKRKMLIAPLGDFDAKDRTHALTVTYGPVIEDPNLETMLQVIDAAPVN